MMIGVSKRTRSGSVSLVDHVWRLSMAAASDKAAKIKLGVAIGAILVASVLMANYFGVFSVGGGGTKGPTISEEEAAQVEKELEKTEADMERRGVGKAGG